MSDLTREAVLEALAKDYFEIDPSHDTYGPVRVDLWDDKIQTFERAKPAELLLALATEVLALRERRCGTCRHWGGPYKPRAQDGVCELHQDWSTMTDKRWFCADWIAKEGA